MPWTSVLFTVGISLQQCLVSMYHTRIIDVMLPVFSIDLPYLAWKEYIIQQDLSKLQTRYALMALAMILFLIQFANVFYARKLVAINVSNIRSAFMLTLAFNYFMRNKSLCSRRILFHEGLFTQIQIIYFKKILY